MNLEELKKVVEEATPGPWINGNDEDSCLCLVGPEDYPGLVGHPVVSLHDERNAEYIATFNPSLVSKLLRAVEILYGVKNIFHTNPDPVLTLLIEALRDLEQS